MMDRSADAPLTGRDLAIAVAIMTSDTQAPHLLEGFLRAHTATSPDGAVVATTRRGEIRLDARGYPLTIADLLTELRADPRTRRVLWDEPSPFV